MTIKEKITLKRFDSFSALNAEFNQSIGGENISPFQSLWFQSVFTKHFCEMKNVYFMGWFAGNRWLGYAAFERVGETILFLGMKPVLGGQELTDYGDFVFYPDFNEDRDFPEMWQSLSEYFKKEGATEIQLDYVREESRLFQRLRHGGFSDHSKVKIVKQEVAPSIALPGNWETYLESLPRVKRKELKRKLKRLESVDYAFISSEENNPVDFAEFVRLNRLSNSLKQTFMSEPMHLFFKDLIAKAGEGWQAGIYFLTIDKQKVAAVLAFLNKESVLLYNSGFDPAHRFYSVGLVLQALLIKDAIQCGAKVYDFLRGDERYKYDLGGINQQLYQIRINLTEVKS